MNFIFDWSTRYLTSKRSERGRYQVELDKIKFISISEYVIFCLLYKHQWNTKWACFQRRDLLCNHNDGDLFSCEDNMLSSRVKTWSFRGKAHLVFHWCLCNKRNYSSCVRLDISLIGCARLWDIESNTQRGIPLSPCAHVSFSSYVANGGDIVACVTIAHFNYPMFLIRKHEEIYFSNRPPFLWVYGRNKPS